MIELIPTRTTDSHYLPARKLMEESFPPEERRTAEAQQHITDCNPYFRPHYIMDEEKFIGLVNYWQFKDFVYIEHLATDPSIRGGGYGGRVLDLLKTQINLPIVLEVEHPDNEIARRRINFYTRHGYSLWTEREYIQPPYAEGRPWLPLLLMVNGPLNEEKDFERIRITLYKQVYNQDTTNNK